MSGFEMSKIEYYLIKNRHFENYVTPPPIRFKLASNKVLALVSNDVVVLGNSRCGIGRKSRFGVAKDGASCVLESKVQFRFLLEVDL